jgi:hypothetical protein
MRGKNSPPIAILMIRHAAAPTSAKGTAPRRMTGPDHPCGTAGPRRAPVLGLQPCGPAHLRGVHRGDWSHWQHEASIPTSGKATGGVIRAMRPCATACTNGHGRMIAMAAARRTALPVRGWERHCGPPCTPVAECISSPCSDMLRHMKPWSTPHGSTPTADSADVRS